MCACICAQWTVKTNEKCAFKAHIYRRTTTSHNHATYNSSHVSPQLTSYTKQHLRYFQQPNTLVHNLYLVIAVIRWRMRLGNGHDKLTFAARNLLLSKEKNTNAYKAGV